MGAVQDGPEFHAAYDAVLALWPAPVHALDLTSSYGTTRVHICGPEDGPPVVLLPGGGTTSMAWFATAADLARTHRLHAVDVIGDIGRSVHDGAPLRGAADLTAWLDTLLDGLGLDRAHLCGHSYGAWIALNYALHAPKRVDRLVLLDPVNCFTTMSPRYLAHGLPALLAPSAERARTFHRWETGSLPENPVWRTFLDHAASAHRSKVVAMRRPKSRDLRACTVPTLVALAGRSRAHNVPATAAAVRRLLPEAAVEILPDVSHHALPTEQPARLNRLLAQFLD
ncbi:alpha/beta fold hydrolase [Streptomyces sp. 7R007]